MVLSVMYGGSSAGGLFSSGFGLVLKSRSNVELPTGFVRVV